LTESLALRIGRFLERQGLLERDAENSYLAGHEVDAGPMEQLLVASINYCFAIGLLAKAARRSACRYCWHIRSGSK
jgi:hypothetical protein